MGEGRRKEEREARFERAAEERLPVRGEKGARACIVEGYFYPEGLRGGVGESSRGAWLAGVPYFYLAGAEVLYRQAALGGPYE